MGKTDSIKQRRVDVYLDTLDRKERWSEIAEEEGDSLSKFVQKAVEYAIEQGGPNFGELSEDSQRIQELEQQVTELQTEIQQKDIVIEKLEDDLRELRMEPFEEEEFEGTRQYDPTLIEILRSGPAVTGDQIRERLDIDPTDTEAMKGLDQQLQQLEAYGLVESTPDGWQWVQ